jgi:serine/threonine protein kinase
MLTAVYTKRNPALPAAARLTEPHIIPIHEAGEIDGGLYLVMPVIAGIDVHSLLQRYGPMSPRRAVQVIEQLAAALDAAHATGLVHRDVKPSNALMTNSDFTYLIDFGIARDAEATQVTKPRSTDESVDHWVS